MRRRSGLPPAPIEFFPRRFYLLVVRERTACSLYRVKDVETEPDVERHSVPYTRGTHFINLNEQLGTISNATSALGWQQTILFHSFLTRIFNGTVSDGQAPDQVTVHRPATVHYFHLQRRHLWQEIHAIHLICRWRLVFLHLSPREALAPFEHLSYLFSSFVAASSLFEPPNLLHSLRGIAKGMETALLGRTLESPCDEESSIHMISHRFLVFDPVRGSQNVIENEEGAQMDKSEPFDCLYSALKRQNVALVIKLHADQHDTCVFPKSSMETIDLSVLSSFEFMDVVSRFLDICESSEGVVAVDGSRGAGALSAATCIGCYLMKHSRFTAEEAGSWLSICLSKPLSFREDRFLCQLQSHMWDEGERFQRQRDEKVLKHKGLDSLKDSTQIQIGKISLGRLALLGARDRDKSQCASVTGTTSVTSCLSSRTLEVQESPTRTMATAQLKRRPLTQGSPGSRRLYRGSEGTNVRADFALMHKFIHQTAPGTRSGQSVPIPSLDAVPSRGKVSVCSPSGLSANCTKALA